MEIPSLSAHLKHVVNTIYASVTSLQTRIGFIQVQIVPHPYESKYYSFNLPLYTIMSI